MEGWVMSKGTKVSVFTVGEHVRYETKKEGGMVQSEGRIAKLHKSGSQGVAEIYPSAGGRKLSRKLQHVFKVQD